MNEPMIVRVDEDVYDSGKRPPYFWTSCEELNFYDFACNWGSNNSTKQYYHVLAYNRGQAEDMTRSEYARTHHISKDWVEVYCNENEHIRQV